jgi:cytochrome c
MITRCITAAISADTLSRLMAALLAMLWIGSVQAGDIGTPEEAKAMAAKAAEFWRTNGEAKALAAFADQSGPFRDRDLYVFVVDDNAVSVVNGGFPTLTGKFVGDLRDAAGKPFVRDFLAIKEEGEVSYLWANPQTKKVYPKVSYCIRVVGVICVGAYKG